MIHDKIDRLKQLAVSHGIPESRVLTPYDRLLLRLNISFVPMIFNSLFEVAVQFAAVTAFALALNVLLGWEKLSLKIFLQYLGAGVLIGGVVYLILVLPIKRKLNLKNWEEF